MSRIPSTPIRCAEDLIRYHGKEGDYDSEEMSFKVRIERVAIQNGNVIYKIRPVAGSGSKWVSEYLVRLDEPPELWKEED